MQRVATTIKTREKATAKCVCYFRVMIPTLRFWGCKNSSGTLTVPETGNYFYFTAFKAVRVR